MPLAKVAAQSGPTLATEACRDMPSAAVAASAATGVAKTVQQIFHRPTFRVYTSGDPIGVELGGALKNVIAIAAGASAGPLLRRWQRPGPISSGPALRKRPQGAP